MGGGGKDSWDFLSSSKQDVLSLGIRGTAPGKLYGI